MKKILLYLLVCAPGIFLAQEKAYLGVYSNTVGKEKARLLNFESPYGAYITKIISNSAAEKSELEVFDYLYAINDENFSKDRSFSHVMRDYQPGDQVKLSFVRNGQTMSRQVTLGSRANARYQYRDDDEDPFLGVHQMHASLPENINGVPVSIVDCSTAEAMGLQKNDIITSIDEVKIIDWHDLVAAINNRSVGDPIKITYYREGAIDSRELPIKSLKATHDCEEDVETIEETVSPIAINEPTRKGTEEEEMEVVMEEITEEEVKAMKEEKGIDMPIVNNLQIEQLNIFPNPTAGAFQLRFELPETGRTSIRIFNGAARLIYQNDLGQFSGEFSDRIDIGSNPAGIYFVEIRQDDKSMSKKLILNKL